VGGIAHFVGSHKIKSSHVGAHVVGDPRSDFKNTIANRVDSHQAKSAVGNADYTGLVGANPVGDGLDFRLDQALRRRNA
jgi:hypothetical protein